MLEWAKEPPNVAGWYWLRVHDTVECAQVLGPWRGKFSFWSMAWEDDLSVRDPRVKRNAEWAGPIPAPRDGGDE